MIARWLGIIPTVMSIVLFTIVPMEADAESTSLRLDPVPRLAIGEYATFTGSLVDSSGRPVAGAEIDIKDDDFGPDDYIATVRTGSDGRFSARVVVKDWDQWGGATDIYAVFEGASGFSKSRSATQEAYVSSHGTGGSSGGSPSGGYYSGGSPPDAYIPAAKSSTGLTLRFSANSVYAGETITFSGQLTSGGRSLSGATIHIKEDDPAWRDEFLATTTTDSQGRYSVTWRASAATFETDFDVYAVFEGSSDYLRSTSDRYTLPVLKRSGTITMDTLPRSVHIGELVTFSGHLRLPGVDTTNILVYIMDEDFGGPDDLLATAYVESDGSYSVSWVARKVDSDNVADIYAVFEGDATHYRLTTCDDGPTRSFGGWCSDTVKLSILAERPRVKPDPPGGQYMELTYSLDFMSRPTVAISPSRDSYDVVRHHITPARAGLEALSSELSARHGGDWLLNYEVLEKGKWRANSRADVVVNLITGYDDDYCNDVLGWAPGIRESRPIQVYVCSTSGQTAHSNAEVMLTATHEFIHAIGLGHVFNKKNDMMCSVEDGVPTCPPSYNEEPRPSSLVLDAIAEVYGRDGFVVPNKGVTNTYFAIWDGRTSPTTQGGTQAVPTIRGLADGGRLVLETVPTRTFSEHASYVESFGYFGPELEFLNDTFILPHDITVSLRECGGTTSSYDQASRTILICYERVADYVDVTYELDFDADDSYAYVFNNVDFELYRGLAYALSHVHDLPTFGYGVHMADSFAAYVMLTFYDDPTIGQDIVYDASTQLYAQSEYGEGNTASHAYDLERFHRITCYAYGQDTESNAYLVTEGWLPENISRSCSLTYARMVDIWDTALSGYMHPIA